jgi:glutamyl-tRNA synthetase
MPPPVVTRFAPSPTGFLHIGGARTALFNWLYAKHTGGKMLLRIEDTDRERSTDAAVAAILDGLSWLGLHWDGEPISQFARAARHRQVAEELVARGAAYRAYDTPEELAAMRETAKAEGRFARYDGRWRDRDASEAPAGIEPVVRIKAPREGETVIADHVQGRVAFPNKDLDDLVILRSDGTPTYMHAVVVDDHDMGVTHVIRGDDHLTNAGRQTIIYQAMGWPTPEWAHIPLIHGPDGTKLSKRHGAVSVLYYREEGYLPEALLNYLARLGWSHGDQEIFTLEEMTALFDIKDVNKSASAINPDKLAWINQQHLMKLPPSRIAQELRWQLERLGVDASKGPPLEPIVESQRERSKTLKEMALASRFFFEAPATYDEKAARKNLNAETKPLLEQARAALAGLTEWTAPAIHGAIQALAEQSGAGLGKIAQPLRVAVSGGGVSPPIDQTLAILGRVETLARVDRAVSQAGRG